MHCLSRDTALVLKFAFQQSGGFHYDERAAVDLWQSRLCIADHKTNWATPKRKYPAWNGPWAGGVLVGGGVSHSKHRSAYSQVERCGAKGGPRLGTTGALLGYSHWPLPQSAQWVCQAGARNSCLYCCRAPRLSLDSAVVVEVVVDWI